MTGVRNSHGRGGGIAAAAAAVALGLALTACSGTTPQTTSAVESPTVTATSVPDVTATDVVEAGSTGPIPTVTADPLTPTRPTPRPSATRSATPTTATTPTTPTTATPAPTPTEPGSVEGACERTLPAYPVLQPGAKAPAVRALQCFLNDADYGPVAVDGVYGDQTRAAVSKVEATFEGPAPQPGRIDAGMWVLLISRTLGDGTLKAGSKGPDVVTLQRALRAAGGTITVDGTFGAETKKVVKRFQQANRIGDDGVVGDETLFLLKMGATIG
jgi:peptidoglycan hydrolase-like protein with peptidoglycan-binding domain